MFEKGLTHLEMRKRMLIAESDINRTLFGRELDALTVSLKEGVKPIKSLGLLASGAAGLVGLFKIFRGKSPAEPAKKFSWLSLLRWGVTVWLGMRAKKASGNGFISKALHSRA